MNATTCAAGEGLLSHAEVANADVVAWQEHHMESTRCDELRGRLKKGKWLSVVNPCINAAADGTSGGVALLTSPQLGQRPPPVVPASVVEEGRVIARRVDGIIPGGLVIACVYLPYDGSPPTGKMLTA